MKLLKTLLTKIKLFFGFCPCGGRIWCWSAGKYKCDKCSETYFS